MNGDHVIASFIAPVLRPNVRSRQKHRAFIASSINHIILRLYLLSLVNGAVKVEVKLKYLLVHHYQTNTMYTEHRRERSLLRLDW